METHFLTLGVIMLLGAMLPGADFAIVTKNALLHSRKAGIYTTLGIGAAICVHMTYCVLGLAVVIKNSPWIFHTIQYVGAAYLIYLGVTLLKPHSSKDIELSATSQTTSSLSNFKAFQQGFICNLFNPKATLFFLTIFSAISTTKLSLLISLAYALEIYLTAIAWFLSLTFLISHKVVARGLNKARKSIEKILGLVLIGLAVFVVFWA